MRASFLALNTAAAAAAKPLPSERLTAKGSPFESVANEVAAVREHMHRLVSKPENEILDYGAKYMLASPGKLLRPALVSLFSHATMPADKLAQHKEVSHKLESLDDIDANIMGRHLRLAEITELIHTASLIHDDVIDNSDLRRGRKSLHKELNNTKFAVLAGDFLLARSSYWIATLGNHDVTKHITRALEDLSAGELMQHKGCCDIESYTEKSYCKTAALIDRSLASAALLSDPTNYTYAKAGAAYGRSLGIAFQVVDDCLDVTGTEEQLGKPKMGDMKEGVATLPIILAGQKDPNVQAAIERKFSQPGDIELSAEAMHKFGTVPEALNIADRYCKEAINAIECLHEPPAKQAMKDAVQVILSRQS
jgi:geranylgeranyl pyrophosphate synthase